METSDHFDLKRLAVAFLRASGCSAVGVEVRSPISRFIFDAAGWRDSERIPKRRRNGDWGLGFRRCEPESIVIECRRSKLRAVAADPSEHLAEDLVIRIEAQRQTCDPDRRVRLLRNIAVSTTKSWLRGDGVYTDMAPVDHEHTTNKNDIRA